MLTEFFRNIFKSTISWWFDGYIMKLNKIFRRYRSKINIKRFTAIMSAVFFNFICRYNFILFLFKTKLHNCLCRAWLFLRECLARWMLDGYYILACIRSDYAWKALIIQLKFELCFSFELRDLIKQQLYCIEILMTYIWEYTYICQFYFEFMSCYGFENDFVWSTIKGL